MRKIGWNWVWLLSLIAPLLLTACGEATPTETAPPFTSNTLTLAPATTPTLAVPAVTTVSKAGNAAPTSAPATVETNEPTLQPNPAATLSLTPAAAKSDYLAGVANSILLPNTSDLRLAEIARSLPLIRPAPEWNNQTWLNSPPLKLADLRGKVILVEFWTFECINCKNVLPAMRQYYDQFSQSGLVMIGFHTPELAAERDWNNVKAAVKAEGINYPVAQDNDSKTWNNFRVNAWPTWFLIDKQGNIRYKHIGEGAYEETALNIQALLTEPQR